MNEQRSDDERQDPTRESEEREPQEAPEQAESEAVTSADDSGDATASQDAPPGEPPAGESDPGEGASDESPTAGTTAATETASDGEAEGSAPSAETDQSDAASPTPTKVRERDGGSGRRPGRAIAILGLLLALAASGAAGYLGWRLYQLEQRVAEVPAQRAAALAPLAEKSALDAAERRFDQRLQEAVDAKAEALVSARDEALGAVRERLGTLEQGVASIRELAARDQVAWRLAEIRYLLAIAQRRVLIARDTRSAIAALESADRAIAELGSVRLLPLRQRIVDDLATLRAVQPADIEGIALRLQNLLGRVPELRTPRERNLGDGGSEAGTGDGWWQRLTSRLDRFVTIRRREAGPAEGRPEPRTGLPEGDRLMLALERARQAALARDPAAYDRALERAQGVLEAGFDPQASTTAQFGEALAYLRERPVAVEMPDLGPTLELADRLSAEIEASRELPAPKADTDEEG